MGAVVLEHAACLARLRNAPRRQIDVDPTREAVGQVPLALPVSHQGQLRERLAWPGDWSGLQGAGGPADDGEEQVQHWLLLVGRSLCASPAAQPPAASEISKPQTCHVSLTFTQHPNVVTRTP
eukprot:4959803-Prymnesium_polylepis.1